MMTPPKTKIQQRSERPGAPTRAGRETAAQPADLPPDFEAWFRDHRESVYRYVRFRLPTREVAEDVTSEVFLKALRALGRYDPRRSAPRTWLLRIARNAVTDYLRALHISLDRVPDLVSQAPSQEERLLREEQLRRLFNAAATLRSADQEILSLRYGAGLGNAEIAETLKITSNAVAVRIHRALGRLRAAVAEDAAGDHR